LRLQHQFAVEREAGQLEPVDQWHDAVGAGLFFLRAHGDVEAGEGCGEADIGLSQGLRDGAGNLGRAGQGRHENGTGVDVMHLMAAQAHIAGAFLAGMEGGAAAAVAGGVDEAGDFGVDAGKAERGFDEAGLEGFVAGAIHMLQLAAAAGAEMRTERFDPVGGRLNDVEQGAAIAFCSDFNVFAGQREGHENLAAVNLGDAFALVAEAGYGGDGHERPELAGAFTSGFVARRHPLPGDGGRNIMCAGRHRWSW